MNIEREPHQGMRHAFIKVLSKWQDGRARSVERLRVELREASGMAVDEATADAFIEGCMVGLRGFRKLAGLPGTFWEPVKTADMKTVAVVQGRTVTGQLMMPYRPSGELLGGNSDLPARTDRMRPPTRPISDD